MSLPWLLWHVYQLYWTAFKVLSQVINLRQRCSFLLKPWTVILIIQYFFNSGIARGCGWQDLGAYVNLVAYYVFGIPIAAAMGFWFQFRGKGLWIGIQVGAALQNILLCIITSCTNWEKQVFSSLLVSTNIESAYCVVCSAFDFPRKVWYRSKVVQFLKLQVFLDN